MNTTVYISGIEPEYKAAALRDVKEKLANFGFSVINPNEMAFAKMGWSDTLQSRLNQLCKCDVIYMMPLWKNDVMARIELTAAMDLHLHTLFHPISNDDVKCLITTLDS